MKAAEVKKMSDAQLTETVKQVRTELFELRNQAVTQKLENPRRLGELRRDVARVLTEQRSRQLAAHPTPESN